ncbi:MAG: Ig-like domain repeat protein [Acidobacteriaceae bacterium]
MFRFFQTGRIVRSLSATLSACALLVLLLTAESSSAFAQAIQFLGAQTVIASQNAGGLQHPQGVGLDSAGNLFVADTVNNRVVEIPLQNGVLNAAGQTVVMTGLNSPSGVALDSANNLYIADAGNNRVVKVPYQSGSYNSGAATTVGTGLLNPVSIAVDAANDLYIADEGNSRIVKVTSGGVQSVFLGGLSTPAGVAVDLSGNVYIAEAAANTVLEVLAATSAQITVSSNVVSPAGLAVDAAGNLYIADSGNNRIVKVPFANGALNPAGQTTVDSNLNAPTDAVLNSSGDFYIADKGSSRIVKFSVGGQDFGAIPVGQTSATATLEFGWNQPDTLSSIRVTTMGAVNLDYQQATGGSCAAGSAYVAGDVCTVNVIFAPALPGSRLGGVVLTDTAAPANAVSAPLVGIGTSSAIAFLPGVQTAVTTVSNPVGIALDGADNLYVAQAFASNSILKISPGGTTSTLGTGLYRPFGVAIDGAGNVYVADTYNQRVVKIAAGSGAQTTVGGGYVFPVGVAVDGAGNVYVADAGIPAGVPAVYKVAANGGAQTTIGTGLAQPYGVAVDPSGNIYIADLKKTSVIEVPVNGVQTTLGNGLNGPSGIAVDGVGNVYVADTNNNRVVEIPANGGAQFTVGTGLTLPSAVAVDANQNVYVADTSNGAVAKVDRTAPPSIAFGTVNVGTTVSHPVTVASVGNQPLHFATINTTDTQGGNFSVDASSVCSTTSPFVVGSTCRLVADFDPQASGASTGTLNLIDDALNVANAKQQIPLTGNSVQTLVSLAFTGPTSIVYGNTVQPFKLTALDGAGFPYTALSGAVTIAVTGTATASIPATFVNGVTSFTLPVLIPGNYTLSATSGGASGTFSLTVTKAPVTMTGVPATLVYGLPGPVVETVVGPYSGGAIATPSGSLTYTFNGVAGTPVALAGGKAGIALPTPLAPGTYVLAVQYPGDSNYLNNTATIDIAVTRAPVTMTLVSSDPASNPGASVTFTATVKSTTIGVPTGTVSFYDGQTLLATTAVDTQGVATYSTSTLTVGTHTIKAVYSGDVDFLGATSTTLQQTVNAPGFSIAASPTTLTLKQGQTGQVNVTMTPVGGYAGDVSLSCTGLPVWAACSFSPIVVTADGNNTAQTSQMTIITLGPNKGTVALNAPLRPASSSAPVAAMIFLPGGLLAGLLFGQRRRINTRTWHLLVLVVLFSGVVALGGCGMSSPSVPVGTYQVKLAAASGSGTSQIVENTSLTLVVTR